MEIPIIINGCGHKFAPFLVGIISRPGNVNYHFECCSKNRIFGFRTIHSHFTYFTERNRKWIRSLWRLLVRWDRLTLTPATNGVIWIWRTSSIQIDVLCHIILFVRLHDGGTMPPALGSVRFDKCNNQRYQYWIDVFAYPPPSNGHI